MHSVTADKRLNRFIFLAISALLTALSVIYPKVGFLSWISIVPAAIVFFTICADMKMKYKYVFWYAFFFFYIFYLPIFTWFLELYPFSFISEMTDGYAILLAGVMWLGSTFLESLIFSFSIVLLAVFARGALAQKYKILNAFAYAGLWAIFEWIQTLWWIGLPWARLAQGQLAFPTMFQNASLFGLYFVSFLIVLCNSFLAFALMQMPKKRLFSTLALSVFLFNFILGTVMVGINSSYAKDAQSVRVAAIQGDVSSQDKWNAETYLLITERFERYTREAAAQGAEIVVWPETILPYSFFEKRDVREYTTELAKDCNITLMLGTFTRYEGEREEYEGMLMNSIVTILPDGTIHETVYNKRALVPFAESVPMRSFFMKFIPPLAEISMIDQDLAPGESSNLIELEYGMIGAQVCFDSIYEHHILNSTRDGAELIIIATNDSWFYDSIGVYMHNGQSQLRAVENGRYIVRAGNTGISSIITPTGEIIQSLLPLVDGYIIDDVYMQSNRTLYSIIGNGFIYLLIGAYVFNISYNVTRKKRRVTMSGL